MERGQIKKNKAHRENKLRLLFISSLLSVTSRSTFRLCPHEEVMEWWEATNDSVSQYLLVCQEPSHTLPGLSLCLARIWGSTSIPVLLQYTLSRWEIITKRIVSTKAAAYIYSFITWEESGNQYVGCLFNQFDPPQWSAVIKHVNCLHEASINLNSFKGSLNHLT